jgi:hypothetical protein
MNKKVTTNIAYALFLIPFYYLQLMPIIGCISNRFFSFQDVIYINLFIKLGCYLSIVDKRFYPSIYLPLTIFTICLIFLWPNFMPSYLLFGFFIYKIRLELESQTDSRIKTYSRLVAFAISPLRSLLLPLTMTFVACALSYDLMKNSQKKILFKLKSIKEGIQDYRSILFHHAHYFAYCYAMPFIFYQKGIVASLLGLFFVMGWALYQIYAKISKPDWRHFMFGHALSSCALISIYLSENIYFMAFFWLLTGFGGGVYFMPYALLQIEKRGKILQSYIAEGIGQIFGIAIWGISSCYIPQKISLLYGALFGVFTVLSGFIDYKKSRLEQRISISSE